MLRNFLKKVQFGFCLNSRLNRLYDTTFQIKDITMIKGTSTETPFCKIEGRRVELPSDKLVFDINYNRKEGDPIIEFFDKDMNLYHPTTPLAVICAEPFFMKQNGEVFCVMNNLPLVEASNPEAPESLQCSPVVEKLCQDSIHSLSENPKSMVSGIDVHNMIITNLLRHGMEFKIDKIRFKELLKVTDRLIENFESEIKEVEFLTRRKANRRLRNYTAFLCTQYLVMHYYIYNHLSWDIMEPISVIFANIDLFVGYLFFVMRGREWSLGEMHNSYIDQKKYANLKKHGVDVEKYDELLKIKEYLELRFNLLSKNPYELM